MSADCGRPFSEELLSGFVDAVLSQGDHQRVRLHIEQCEHCRGRVEELATLRRAALETTFKPPIDDQWNEAPRGVVSRLARNLGWLVLVVWALATVALLVWLPEQGSAEPFARFVIIGSLVGWAALLISVAIDRFKARRKDIYREVEK